MERFSVKKPFTVLVAVIMVLVLGFISVTRMTTDLLPSISLPYMIVITTYPGASPEKVESAVTEPMESALGTVTGVENVYSTSSENYSMVQLEFEDGTDMDSAMVKVSSSVQQVSASLPDTCGTPSILEVSMDMMATMYVGVSREGYDIYQTSDFVSQDVVPYLERQAGVASVTSVGLVEKSVQVDLNQEKIDAINDKILAAVDDQLAEAAQKLDEAQAQVESGQAALQHQQDIFGETFAGALFDPLSGSVNAAAAQMKVQLDTAIGQLEAARGQISDSARLQALDQAVDAARTLSGLMGKLAGGNALTPAEQAQGAAALATLEQALAVLAGGGTPAATPTPTATPTATPAPTATPTATPTPVSTATPSAAPTATPEATPETTDSTAAPSVSPSASPDGGASGTAGGDAAAGNTAGTLAARSSGLHLQPLSAVQDAAADLTGTLNGLQGMLSQVSGLLGSTPQILDGLEGMVAGLTEAQLQAAVGFSTAQIQLAQAQSQLESARSQYEAAREQALEKADVSQLLSMDTLSGILYAQNFSMPAGYIDDANDGSWLLKVGEEYDSETDIADTLLCTVEGVGDVRLSDVADVTVIDNAGQSYAKLNDQDGVVLCIYKGSTAGTNEVSRNCAAALEELSAQYSGFTYMTLMDQGTYITLIVNSVLSSMALGAVLAILVLALFLKDIKPTLVVGISIPLSVLFAIVLMYFTGLSLNMMTLSGLALGIGMLVDNSIVVMENIYRLRSRGVSAARAAVQGTRQVTGSIVASTLTTVCVFLPMVFTSGTVRELLMPMGLAITYCLTASLIVAMTVVPATGSTILRNAQPKKHPWFDKVLEGYGRSLAWCLQHKAAPLALAILLLAGCVWQLLRMGIVIIPSMTSNQIQVSVTTPEDMDTDTSYATMDQVIDAMLTVDGVDSVGVMDAGSTAGLIAGMAGGSGSTGSYVCYVMADEDLSDTRIQQVCDDIEAATADLDCTVDASAGGMSDMSSLMSSGLSINIYGSDMDTLVDISEDVMDLVGQVEGFTDPSNGMEEGEQTVHLVIDRDKAMRLGLTTAQIYQQIAARLTDSVAATTITPDGMDLSVNVQDKTDPLTLENLMDMPFTTQAMGGTGTDLADMDLSDMAGALSGTGTGTATEETHTLSEFATLEYTQSVNAVNRENQTPYLTVTAGTAAGYNTTLLSRELAEKLDSYSASSLPDGYSIRMAGETEQVNDMISQMLLLMGVALIFVYLVMVAQFQSLLSPFIVMFTIPLAFTGGMLGLLAAGEQLSLISLMGFLVLMGTVVNNGIVFVDYTNQLRDGGMERRPALIAAGKTRMRPILMTALTTILAMAQLIFGDDMGSQLGRGMAIVIAAGLGYATLTTLYIVPVMYDLLFKRPPLHVDLGSENLDDVPDDAAEFIQQALAHQAEQQGEIDAESTTDQLPAPKKRRWSWHKA